MGYTLNEVVSCITGLRAEHFQKSLAFPNATYDVYICSFRYSDDRPPDTIYMKLRLLGTGELVVGVGSFHL